MPPPIPPHYKPQPKREGPKRLRDVPRYIWDICRGFFSRLFYIVRLVWETNPWILLLLLFFCVCDGILPVVGAYIAKDLLNAVSDLLHTEETIRAVAAGSAPFVWVFDAAFRTILFLLLFYFVYQFFSKIISRLSTMVSNVAGELVCNHIKLKIMEKAKTVDLASFDRPEFYEKLENANREAGMRPLSIMRSTFNVISTSISIVSFALVLVGLHPLAPIVIAVMALPGAVVSYIYRNKQFRYMRFRSKERRQMEYFSSLPVNKDMAKEVRIMGLSDTFIGRYKQAFARYFKGLKKLAVGEGLWQMALALLSLAAHFFLFLFIAYRVVNGGGAIGDYSLYTGALNSVSTYVTALVTATATIYEGTLFIDNMMVFMKEKVTVAPTVDPPRKPQEHRPHTLEFRDVSFRYPGGTRDVIKHVSFRIEPGENVVLVGLNGAGKTTLIKLLTRLYDPTEGQVLLDGVDVREYDVAALYHLFGIIFQDFGKYAVSVGENIAYGDVGLPQDEEKIKRAAMLGNADEFISRLPEGYNTPLMRFFEENGTDLSIGQWQKLSISRAFYKDSDILILDEPTASLDPLAEEEIFRQFAALSANKIALFVSHRLSSATTADKIIVLEHGSIVEMGNHEELMKKGGKYHHLFSTQAQHYIKNRPTEEPKD